MFRPLISHHQVVLNLSSNYTIYVMYSGGDEISFTIVSGINTNFNRLVTIIDSIYYSLTSQWTDNVHKPKYVTLN